MTWLWTINLTVLIVISIVSQQNVVLFAFCFDLLKSFLLFCFVLFAVVDTIFLFFCSSRLATRTRLPSSHNSFMVKSRSWAYTHFPTLTIRYKCTQFVGAHMHLLPNSLTSIEHNHVITGRKADTEVFVVWFPILMFHMCGCMRACVRVCARACLCFQSLAVRPSGSLPRTQAYSPVHQWPTCSCLPLPAVKALTSPASESTDWMCVVLERFLYV